MFWTIGGGHTQAFTQQWECCFGLLPIQNVVTLVALGVGIDRRGSVECAMDHRLRCFDILWSSVKARFCDRRVPLTLSLEMVLHLGAHLPFHGGGLGTSRHGLG